jgi:hypothetical protein
MVQKLIKSTIPGFTGENSILRKESYSNSAFYVQENTRYLAPQAFALCPGPEVCADPDVQFCRCRKIHGQWCCDAF